MKAVVTVIGKDQKGIIAKISNILFENEVNILDISQTIMQDMFILKVIPLSKGLSSASSMSSSISRSSPPLKS